MPFFHIWHSLVLLPAILYPSISTDSSSSGCPIRIISPASNDNTINKTGNLSSWILFQDNHLPRPSKCQIIFVGSGHERVQVSFPKFNLFSPIKYNNTQRCEDRDHLTAHVLVGTRMSRIDDFCADRTPPQLMSSKNLLTLDYVRKPTAPDDEKPFGFFLKYQFRTDLGLSDMHAKRDDSKPCQFIFNSTKKTSGNLWSPNHPGLYPRNINCNYIFHGTATQVVVIHFEYFDVEGFAQCEDSTQSDYVLFSNYQTHDRTNRRYCGRTRPSVSIVSESNYFRMMFKSNDIFEATGFYAHYQFITPKSAQTNRVKLSSSGASSLILSISTVIFALYLWINS
ncbi:hypothetical protein L596_008027 [Steinernema carpocapsae]|nr:hypothetical protein L596_008027 [Steinernema carpocapsae]